MTRPAITAIALAALASLAACSDSPPPPVPAASPAQTAPERLGLRALKACMSRQTADQMQGALTRAGFSYVGEIAGDRTLREPTGAVSVILTGSSPLSSVTCVVNMTGVSRDRALSFVQSALQVLDGPPARLGDDLVRTGWTGSNRGKTVVVAVLTLGSQGPDASIVYDIRQ